MNLKFGASDRSVRSKSESFRVSSPSLQRRGDTIPLRSYLHSSDTVHHRSVHLHTESFLSYLHHSSSFFPPYFALYVPELTKVVLIVYFSRFWVIELSGRCKI